MSIMLHYGAIFADQPTKTKVRKAADDWQPIVVSCRSADCCGRAGIRARIRE